MLQRILWMRVMLLILKFSQEVTWVLKDHCVHGETPDFLIDSSAWSAGWLVLNAAPWNLTGGPSQNRTGAHLATRINIENRYRPILFSPKYSVPVYQQIVFTWPGHKTAMRNNIFLLHKCTLALAKKEEVWVWLGLREIFFGGIFMLGEEDAF